MNNHRDILGIAFNVLVVLFMLALIVFGLNKIGVYNLPAPIEKLIGTYNEVSDDNQYGNNNVVDSMVYDDYYSGLVTSSEITYENARVLLESIVPADNYSQDISVQYFQNNKKNPYIEKISVNRRKGLYSATVMDLASGIVKTIQEKNNVISVLPEGKEENWYELPKGEFDISDECGFILTVENFINSQSLLEQASFSLSKGNFGSEITIVFDSVIDGYTQKEQYTVSLDFGVVISAECYENDTLVYSMSTNNLCFSK